MRVKKKKKEKKKGKKREHKKKKNRKLYSRKVILYAAGGPLKWTGSASVLEFRILFFNIAAHTRRALIERDERPTKSPRRVKIVGELIVAQSEPV